MATVKAATSRPNPHFCPVAMPGASRSREKEEESRVTVWYFITAGLASNWSNAICSLICILQIEHVYFTAG